MRLRILALVATAALGVPGAAQGSTIAVNTTPETAAESPTTAVRPEVERSSNPSKERS